MYRYARSYLSDTTWDPNYPWMAITYSWFFIETLGTLDRKPWYWLSVTVFLSDRNDESSIEAICYGPHNCHRKVPMYQTSRGTLAPIVVLGWDDAFKQFVPLPYSEKLSEPGVVYPLVDYDLLNDVQKKAINSDAWTLTNRISDKNFKSWIGDCRRVYNETVGGMLPDVLDPQ